VRFSGGLAGVAAAVLIIGGVAVIPSAGADVAVGRAAAAAPGTTLYVNVNGTCSDSGPGTQADPFCTVQAAANVVDPGQTVDIVPGRTDPQSVTITRSGTPTEPITFTWAGTGVDPALAPGKQTGKAVITLQDVDDVTLSHLDVDSLGTDDAIDVIGSSGISLANLEISHRATSQSAPPESDDIMIDGASSDVTVSRTTFYVGPFADAVLAEPGAQQVTLTTNVVTTASAESGFTLDGTTGAVVTSNTLSIGCPSGSVARTVVALADDSSGTVQNNVLEPLSASTCPASATALSVDASSADSAGGVTADYNAFYTAGPASDYSWAGASYPDPAAFTAATGQGAHDVTLASAFYAAPPKGSAAINSANCSAPGELSTDVSGNPWVSDPQATDASLGNGSCYASRGAYAPQDSMPVTYTAPPPVTTGYSAGEVPFTFWVTVTSATTSGWGEPVSYTVNFGDGSAPVPAVPGTAAGRTYTTAGQYAVTITAADTSGSTDTVTLPQVYAVPDQGPTAGLSAAPEGLGSSLGIQPDTAAFTGTTGLADWEIASSSISYGDSGQPVIPDDPNATWEYTYAEPGTYTATLTVTDKLGRTSTAKATITVGDEPQEVFPTYDYSHSVAAHAVVKIPLTQLDGNDCCARAALVDVIVTDPSKAGYVTVYPNGTAQSGLATVQFQAGRSAENSALATGATVDFYNASDGTIDLNLVTYGIDDLTHPQGTGENGETYSPVSTATVLPRTLVAGGHQVAFPVTGLDDVPANARDVVLDITAYGGSTAGEFAASPDSADGYQLSRTVGYWAKGQQVTDLAMASPADDRVTVQNEGSGSASFSASVVGYYLNTGSDSVFLPATPRRLDTVTIGARQSVSLAVTGRNGIPATGTTAVAINLNAARATASGTIAAYADGTPTPAPMNLSYAPGVIVANAAIVAVGKDGAIRLYNGGSRPVTVYVDLTGSYFAYP
jgi:PKD repeat protein